MSALFDQPERESRPLSKMYSVKAYRSDVSERARYADIKSQSLPHCDECFANQHENSSAYRPRAMAKVRRSFRGGPSLNLCRNHAALWKARDEEDAPPK